MPYYPSLSWSGPISAKSSNLFRSGSERITGQSGETPFRQPPMQVPNPGTISSMKRLQRMDFGTNKLSGSLPRSVAGLKFMDLARNKLSDSIPEILLRANEGLGALWLDDNLIFGRLPDALSFMKVPDLASCRPHADERAERHSQTLRQH